MHWLKKLLSTSDAPPPPVLLRIAEPSGAPPEKVAVEASWYPSGRRAQRSHSTAAGLCVVPWLGDEDRVRLTVRSAAGAHTLEVARNRPDGGRVQDVRLTRIAVA